MTGSREGECGCGTQLRMIRPSIFSMLRRLQSRRPAIRCQEGFQEFFDRVERHRRKLDLSVAVAMEGYTTMGTAAHWTG